MASGVTVTNDMVAMIALPLRTAAVIRRMAISEIVPTAEKSKMSIGVDELAFFLVRTVELEPMSNQCTEWPRRSTTAVQSLTVLPPTVKSRKALGLVVALESAPGAEHVTPVKELRRKPGLLFGSFRTMESVVLVTRRADGYWRGRLSMVGHWLSSVSRHTTTVSVSRETMIASGWAGWSVDSAHVIIQELNLTLVLSRAAQLDNAHFCMQESVSTKDSAAASAVVPQQGGSRAVEGDWGGFAAVPALAPVCVVGYGNAAAGTGVRSDIDSSFFRWGGMYWHDGDSDAATGVRSESDASFVWRAGLCGSDSYADGRTGVRSGFIALLSWWAGRCWNDSDLYAGMRGWSGGISLFESDTDSEARTAVRGDSGFSIAGQATLCVNDSDLEVRTGVRSSPGVSLARQTGLSSCGSDLDIRTELRSGSIFALVFSLVRRVELCCCGSYPDDRMGMRSGSGVSLVWRARLCVSDSDSEAGTEVRNCSDVSLGRYTGPHWCDSGSYARTGERSWSSVFLSWCAGLCWNDSDLYPGMRAWSGGIFPVWRVERRWSCIDPTARTAVRSNSEFSLVWQATLCVSGSDSYIRMGVRSGSGVSLVLQAGLCRCGSDSDIRTELRSGPVFSSVRRVELCWSDSDSDARMGVWSGPGVSLAWWAGLCRCGIDSDDRPDWGSGSVFFLARRVELCRCDSDSDARKGVRSGPGVPLVWRAGVSGFHSDSESVGRLETDSEIVERLSLKPEIISECVVVTTAMYAGLVPHTVPCHSTNHLGGDSDSSLDFWAGGDSGPRALARDCCERCLTVLAGVGHIKQQIVWDILWPSILLLRWPRPADRAIRVTSCGSRRKFQTGFEPMASLFLVLITGIVEITVLLGIFYRLLALNLDSLKYKSISATFSLRQLASIFLSGSPVVRLTSWQSLCTVIQFLQLGFVGIVILVPETDAKLAWLVTRLAYLLLAEKMASNHLTKPRRARLLQGWEMGVVEKAATVSLAGAGRPDGKGTEQLPQHLALRVVKVDHAVRTPATQGTGRPDLESLLDDDVLLGHSVYHLVNLFTSTDGYPSPDLYSGDDAASHAAGMVSPAERPGSPARQGAGHE